MTSPDTLPAAPRRRTWMPVCAAIFAAGLAYWVFSAATQDAARAWRAMLINFLFFSALACGLVAWSAVELLSNGRWSGRNERWALAGLGAWPLSIVPFAALWIALGVWAPWKTASRPDLAWWMNPTFIMSRNAVCLIALWAVAWWYVRARLACRRPGTLAGCLLLVFAVALTVQAFDLVMALDIHWFSTLFGGYFAMTGMYAAVAAWTLAAIRSGDAQINQRHDLGKLIVALGLISTYLMFSQLLPIWYENFPVEARFVVPRLRQEPWRAVSAVLLCTIYLGPLVMLLTRWSKRSRRYLSAVAVLVLAGLWLERWWLIAPASNASPVPGMVEISLTAAFAAGAALCIGWRAGRMPARPFEKESPGE